MNRVTDRFTRLIFNSKTKIKKTTSIEGLDDTFEDEDELKSCFITSGYDLEVNVTSYEQVVKVSLMIR